MLLAFADAVVLTLPAAEPLDDPPGELVAVVLVVPVPLLLFDVESKLAPLPAMCPFSISAEKTDPDAAVMVLSAPIPLTVTLLLLSVGSEVFAKAPEMVPMPSI